jgi:hypothetical protein
MKFLMHSVNAFSTALSNPGKVRVAAVAILLCALVAASTCSAAPMERPCEDVYCLFTAYDDPIEEQAYSRHYFFDSFSPNGSLDFTLILTDDPDTLTLEGLLHDEIWGVHWSFPFHLQLTPDAEGNYTNQHRWFAGPRVTPPNGGFTRNWVNWSFFLREIGGNDGELRGYGVHIQRVPAHNLPEPSVLLLTGSGILAMIAAWRCGKLRKL